MNLLLMIFNERQRSALPPFQRLCKPAVVGTVHLS